MNSARGHIGEFDGLRGLAILAVLLHHFWPRSGALAPWGSLAHMGWVGVDLFFVISGCLIAGILLDTRGEPGYFRNFYTRRTLRIFPLYFLFIGVAYLVIPPLQSNAGGFVRESGPAWWYVFYLGNIRESLTGLSPHYVLAPTWSLCIEEHFYLAFPLLVALLPLARLRATLWGLILLAPAFRLAMALLWPANDRFQYMFTLSRVDILALGCLLALGFRGHAWLPSPRLTIGLLPAALVGCAVAFGLGGLDRTTLFGRTAGYCLIGVTAFLLVLWAVQWRDHWSSSWLRFRPLCAVGILCYGLYLLHRPAEALLAKTAGWLAPGLDLDSAGGLALRCLTALGVAVASWYCLERPFLGLKRYFASVRHPAIASAPAEPVVVSGAPAVNLNEPVPEMMRPQPPFVERY